MWKVLAYGADTGSLYVYQVFAPKNAYEIDVACCAYARHGQSFTTGDVTEYLGDDWNAEWVEVED